MRKFIPLLFLFLLLACQTESRFSKNNDPLKKVELITPKGDAVETTLVILESEQQQGLSGTKPEDFADNQGMMFFYTETDERHFWMPDTYFDLDLFYLDGSLKIIDIVRKLPHYIGRANPELIPRARPVWCQHVLEMKSTSPISQSLKVGDTFQWKSSLSLKDTEKRAKELLQAENNASR